VQSREAPQGRPRAALRHEAEKLNVTGRPAEIVDAVAAIEWLDGVALAPDAVSRA
jgi:hypothetical protein